MFQQKADLQAARPVARVLKTAVNLQPREDYLHTLPVSRFLGQVVKEPKLHHLSRKEFHHVSDYTREEVKSPLFRRGPPLLPTSLLAQTVHGCFARHLPLSLAPEVIWYTVLHEVALAVKADPVSYAPLFTARPDEKKTVRVHIDSFVYGQENPWEEGVLQFEDKLRFLVPHGLVDEVMLPLSTDTLEARAALLVAFMDAASPFYEYRMRTLCGIPQVRLEGQADDWWKLAYAADNLAKKVSNGHMALYRKNLLPVLQEIAATADGSQYDHDFWRSLDSGSGGPYVNGWLTALFAHVSSPKGPLPKPEKLFDWTKGGFMSGLHTDQFPSHVSSVPFLWEYYTKEIPMQLLAGVLGVEWEDGFLAPRLGFAVREVTDGRAE